MKKRKIIRGATLLSALCLTLACEPDDYPTYFVQPEGQDVAWAELPVSIGTDLPQADATKASLLKDVEEQGSGALVLVFRTATGRMESYRYYTQDELQNQARTPLKLRVPLAECDFYILGNLNAVRKSDGKAFCLTEALGDDFPMDETSLEAMVYRLDGGDLNGTYRRERFAEVASCGIPYAHIRKTVNTAAQLSAGKGIPDSDKCKRLFSKVTVRIDHSAFDGSGANPDYFVNRKLYLRQANGRLQPFSTLPQKASEAVDVLSQSDYDPDMSATSASVATYSFYVPENMQGTLLPGNADSRRKTRDELIAQGKSAAEPYVTYVEFEGALDPAAGGFGGDVTYRFYVGADNCSNFDLERGREYDIRLSFRVGSLFEPDWKVKLDNWTDTRLFCLTADAAFTDRLEDARTVAVRKNRDGAFYLYMNTAGRLGADNALLGKDAASSAALVPASLSDCSWYADWMSGSGTDAAWLAARGIKPVWDKTTGCLRLSVVDAALFDAHRGEERVLSLTLLPNGAAVRFKLRLCDDIVVSVSDGKSLTDEFYLGQKRTVTVSGFTGSTVCYAADQDPCGSAASGAAHTANRQWKADNGGGAFPGCVVDAAGRISRKVADYPAQRLGGGRLDVYAFYPNRFLDSHGGWTSRNGKILFFSEDYLNDTFEVDVRISEPRAFRPADYSGATYLPLDGNEVSVPQIGYKTFDGGDFLPTESFDATLFSNLLAFRVALETTDPASFLSGVSYDYENSRMCLKVTSNASGNLEDKPFNSQTGVIKDGKRITVHTNDATGLFKLQPDLSSGVVLSRLIYYSRLLVEGFNADGGTHYAIDPSEAQFSVRYFYNNPLVSPIDQFVDDESFSIWVKYRGRGYDWPRVTVRRTGPETTFRTPTGLRYGPVLEVVEEMPDTGSGGKVRWLYDESHQVMLSSNGEPVPGGMLLPYGEQTVSLIVENKWDHRQIEMAGGITLTLNYTTMYGFFVGATRDRYASVFYLPLKTQKYLMRMGARMTAEGRGQLLSFLNTQEWYNHMGCRRMYRKSGSGYYLEAPGSGLLSLPQLGSFDVRYLEGSFSSASAWTQAAMDYFDGRWGSGLAGGNDFVFGRTVPQRGEWGPYIANENGAAGDTWRGVFVDTTGAFF